MVFGKIEDLGYEKEFFFLAPIGRSSLADGQPPAPFGFEALFSWLVNDLRDGRIIDWIRRHRILITFAAIVVLLATGMSLYRHVRQKQAARVLMSENVSEPEQIKAIEIARQPDKDDFIDKKIADIEKNLSSIYSISELEDFQKSVSELKGKGSTAIESRLSELDKRLREKREDLHVKRILDLEQENIAKCRDAISEYHLDMKTARRREAEVGDIGKRLDDAERNTRRADIRKTIVISGRLDTLKSRCDLIEQYPFPDQTSQKEAERAVAIGRLMLADSPYHVEIKSAKGLSEAYRTRLELSNLGPSTLQQEETVHQKSSNPQWNKKVKFRWKPADRIKVEWLWSSHWGPNDTVIGTREFKDPWTALIDLLGGVQLTPETGPFHANLEDTPQATIICQEFPNPAEDLRVFNKYIVPGTYWQ